MKDFVNDSAVQSLVKNTLLDCDDGELFVEETISESLLLDDNVLKNASYNKKKGFGLRAINSDLVGYSHSNTLNLNSLKIASETVSAVKKGYSGTLDLEPPKTNRTLYTHTNPIETIEYKSKVKLLNSINEYARSLDNRTRQVSVSLSGTWQKINILRPTGEILEDINTPLLLLVPNGREEEVITRLSRVGFDHTLGYLEGGIKNWKSKGKLTSSIDSTEGSVLKDLENKSNNSILDVRSQNEHQNESISGSLNIPLKLVNQSINQIDFKSKFFIHCQGGYRSMIAASILKKNGIHSFYDVKGGYNSIKKASLNT